MLTTQQKQTLKEAILANPEWAAQPMNSDGDFAIALALQEPASPELVVWRTAVPKDEIMQNGFDWVQVDNLTIGKARIWDWLFDNEGRTMNPAKTNVRAGIAECWKGTAAMLAVQAAVLGHCKRSANKLEAIFAVGSGTTLSPSTMAVEGSISYQEVGEARAL